MAKDFHSQIEDFFSALAPEEQERIISGKGLWEKKYLERGTQIFEEGEQSSELYLLLNGHIEVAKRIRNDQKKVLAILDPGSIFGEGSLLSEKPRAASTIAIDDSEVLVLKKTDFEKLLVEKPEAASALLLALFKVVNQRLQWANQELVAMYDLSKMMHDFKGNIDKLLMRVSSKLALATQAPKGAIALKNQVTGHLEVKVTWGDYSLSTQELLGVEDILGRDRRHLVNDGRMIAAIRDLYGDFWGAIIMDGVEEWLPGPRKMARTTAEQLGIVLADYHLKESEVGRSKLKQQNVQF
ncbi:cyclic nucleotide-binding domain-containing protein [Candidatus Peregrinibacteria bacterium]|jgi:CRP-like cAMP-binding protein|nr:cyclic nucleotide-binding domain-containing protein [Candidatus Peregrinibacteria bacterium]MBT7484232.1 cyclic nucleotide-binding domain-containing protein [Candidatus Peregrinibacteria bacterium]MBT7703241.1 cyclic nucleotide-binding domain-containing protein [Candidatus Peregrinibacteria bacterium]